VNKFKHKHLARSISLILAGSAVPVMIVTPAQAQDASGSALEEIIVTAQKREENLQDVAVSIQVLDNQALENLNVRSFADMIDFMPTVAFASGGATGGPGFGQVYMRGIASGGDGNHSASMPSVGYYLDEQPVTTINQVLDIHLYDIARVETLAGPQGTLYGQGSQSGTIRIITNKPVMGETEGGIDVEANATKNGDPGYNLNGFINLPIGERAAVRLVAWHKELGGFIDQVPTTMTFPGPQTNTVDNSAFAGENANTATTTGLRGLLKIDLSDNWSITPGLIVQQSDNEGYWEHNPEFFGDLETGRLWPADGEDDWVQASLTLEGSIGGVDVVYAGANLDREQDYEYDYSDYTEYWAYQGVDYADPADRWCVYYNDQGDCAIGTQYVDAQNDFSRQSHELRFQSATDQSFRWIAGAFFQSQEHEFDLQWTVPDSDTATSVVEGGNVVWQTHQVREDEDTAYFGELTYDFTDQLTATVGARYFEYDNSLYGFNGFLEHCTGQYVGGEFVQGDPDNLGPNDEIQYPCFDTRILDDVATSDDWAFKFNMEYSVTDDMMFYLTWSEGFRAGGVNRARVPDIPTYGPDFVTNYEIGWKMMLGDSVRFNGAIYKLDWDDFQFGFLDFTVSNLTIVQNVGNSSTTGVEWDLTWAANDNNTLTFSGSYNDAELQTDFWRTKDLEDAGDPANAPAGTPMPYVPDLQLTGIWRSNFDIASMPGFFQAAVAYTSDRWNDLDTLNVPARREMAAYTLVNLSAGIEKDTWGLTLYIRNLFDERAEIDFADPGYGGLANLERPPGHVWTSQTIRPLSYGVRYSQRF
jgi:iron complex outermembrane receptor protein